MTPSRTHPKRLTGSAAALLAAALLAGCGSTGVPASPPAPIDRVDEILVQTSPTAMDRGLAALVFLFRHDRDLPVTVRGTLEATVYEGAVPPEQLAQARPFRSWRFAARTLEDTQVRSAVGWGYSLPLLWGAARPTTGSLTLTCRYVPRTGPPVNSRPMTIAIGPK